MTCLIAGDSIAVGAATAEGLSPRWRPACTVNAKVGIPSAQIIGRISAADLTVISAGSNDPDNPRLFANLLAIRAKVTGKVLWIVPVNSIAAGKVLNVAAHYGDATVTFTPGSDHVHPQSYLGIEQVIRRAE